MEWTREILEKADKWQKVDKLTYDAIADRLGVNSRLLGVRLSQYRKGRMKFQREVAAQRQREAEEWSAQGIPVPEMGRRWGISTQGAYAVLLRFGLDAEMRREAWFSALQAERQALQGS